MFTLKGLERNPDVDVGAVTAGALAGHATLPPRGRAGAGTDTGAGAGGDGAVTHVAEGGKEDGGDDRLSAEDLASLGEVCGVARVTRHVFTRLGAETDRGGVPGAPRWRAPVRQQLRGSHVARVRQVATRGIEVASAFKSFDRAGRGTLPVSQVRAPPWCGS